MQKHRFISKFIIAAAIAVAFPVMTPSPALADGPYGSASESERLGCQSDGYKLLNTWALRYSGDAHEGIGYVMFLVRPSPSNPDNIRVCAIVYHGDNTWGLPRYTALEVGSEPRGSNSTQDLFFWDTGTFRYHTDGRAITPGMNRCAVIHGLIKSADGTKSYQVWIDQEDVADSNICNY